MKAQTLRDVQLQELRILEAFDGICNKAGLSYFFVSGTLLGAMRHNGFIPWDDDIDVGMLPEDYRRFSRIAASMLPRHLAYHAENENGSWLGFAKISDGELDIDVFPFEPKPNLPYSIVRKLLNFRHGCFWRIRRAKMSASRHVAAVWSVVHVLSVIVWKICCMLFPFGGLHMRPETGFTVRAKKSQIVPLSTHEFEGRQYPIPADAEAVLASEYKNWRELPPEEQRVPSHINWTFT